jgi:hypothetical protein
MTPANLDIRTASLPSFAFPDPARFRGRPQLLTRPCPSRRGTWLAYAAATTTANANGEANTITFETATYTLTAVDNKADAPNARQHPCDNPEPASMSPKWITRACGLGHWGPSDQCLGRARKKWAGICRVGIKKTEWDPPLNFALITEGLHMKAGSCQRRHRAVACLCLNSISIYL